MKNEKQRRKTSSVQIKSFIRRFFETKQAKFLFWNDSLYLVTPDERAMCNSRPLAFLY